MLVVRGRFVSNPTKLPATLYQNDDPISFFFVNVLCSLVQQVIVARHISVTPH